ncbi:hypothetical protein ABZ330_16680 [Streptomyces sp. NPDC006172]|uniref:DUF7417 domain-containing protein n=1 Tax=Streptomyces sp. NPDC006172 TaxID=3154470 RepID=UPI0033C1993B
MGRMKDIATDLISYELGELDDTETLELFATLIKSGMAWTLQGGYGRTAARLIEGGLITPEGDVIPDVIEELLAA